MAQQVTKLRLISSCHIDLSLGDSIHTLLSYSLAKRTSTSRSDSFNIHPLVHEWTRRRLETEPETRDRVTTKAFSIVSTAINIPEDQRKAQDWVFERRILPHINAISAEPLKLEPGIGIEKIESLVNGEIILASFFQRHGEYDQALNQIMAASTMCKLLGEDHQMVFTVANWVGSILGTLGKYGEALEWYRRALAGREKSQAQTTHKPSRQLAIWQMCSGHKENMTRRWSCTGEH